MKSLSLHSEQGCKRLLAICLAVILVFSCAAHLLTTDWGSVKIERVAFDARGAKIDAELYYPVGTTDEDKLPAVVVTHGAGCTFGVTRGIAEELARRGFVVLNVSAYGSGLSEFPERDECGMGEENYNARETPGGLWDALNFVRTLKFVDPERIGMTGHSQGSRRTSHAAQLDCGYLTLNDILINILYEQFDQSFTEDEITLDAYDLAAERLNADQMAFFESLAAEATEHYNTRLRAQLLIGGDGTMISPLQTVEVGGHEVQRNCQVNLGFVIGEYDTSYTDYVSRETTMESYYTDTPLEQETWYVIDDTAKTSTSLGSIFDTSIEENEALQQAVANRQARIVSFNTETHARNHFSHPTATDVVKFFEQTLSYNCGELTDSATQPLDAHNIIYIWREALNAIAMLGMLGMLLPLACLLMRSRFFAVCNNTAYLKNEAGLPKIGKTKFLVIGLCTLLIAFVSVYRANLLQGPFLPYYEFLPLFFNWWYSVAYLAFVALGALVLLVVFWYMDKKAGRPTPLAAANLKIGVLPVLKNVLLAVLLAAAGYASLCVIEYLFNEDFRFWQLAFIEMKVEYWFVALRYFIVLLPMLLIISTLTNYTMRRDIPEWLDTLFTVAVPTVGVGLCWLINYIVLHMGGTAICNWNSSYSLLFMVPITTYLMRKLYKVSGSVWLPAITNALLVSWTMVSSIGYNTYVAQTAIDAFFHI